MLRRHYAYNSPELQGCLERFYLGGVTLIDVKLYRMLTPDSFIWKLRMTDGIYYLYAEDYVPGLGHVQQQLDQYTQSQKGHFIETNDQKAFTDLSAVRVATTYPKPDDYETEMVKYAVDSGFDLVFLYKIDELSEEDKQDL